MSPSDVRLPDYRGRKASLKDRHKFYRRLRGEQAPCYVAADDLVEVINMAKRLGRPLLLEGEPGCGKTTLARHVAWTVDAPYHEWHVKSAAKARDGLYVFDTVGRLRDAQLAPVDKKAKARAEDPRAYVQRRPLGEAFAEEKRPAVVLIDEIDKADSDFPNDLLLELDRMCYAEEEVSSDLLYAKHRPLVIITSNREKALPHAFLRRCLYFYIEFPGEDVLGKIIEAHEVRLTDGLLNAAIDAFLKLRKKMQESIPKGEKVPDVAELLDWLNAVSHLKQPTPEELQRRLPASYVLLKNEADRERFR